MVFEAIRLELLYRGMETQRTLKRSDDPAPARLVEEELVREENQERSLLKRSEGGMLKIRRLWFRKHPPSLWVEYDHSHLPEAFW